MNRASPHLGALAVLAMVGWLTACGGDDDAAEEPAMTTADTTSAPAADDDGDADEASDDGDAGDANDADESDADDADDAGDADDGGDGATAPSTAEEAPAPDEPEPTAPATEVTFEIEGITDGEPVPVEYTCDGANQPPVITVRSVPDGTEQLAVIVDDPDAPRDDPFVHWVVYRIPAATTEITDESDDLTYGLNDAGVEAWSGPCPPPGDGPHRYFFAVHALDAALDLEAGLDGRALFAAIEDSIIASAEVVATYERG